MPDAAASRLEDLVVITGFSGAGKSTALAVFEDSGYFCVDNLPPEMIRGLVELFLHEGSKVERAAVVSDVRTGELFEALHEVLAGLEELGAPHRMLFLDADEQTLLNRYKETRRRHPLAPRGSVATGIAAERTLLEAFKGEATAVLDTTGLSATALRRMIAEHFLPREVDRKLAVTFQSFGHKHGPPRDADLAFDVRFLPNPHYVPELKPMTGKDQEIVEYVGRDGHLQQFYDHLEPLLDYLLPRYEAEGKAHLMVAIGCTGGQHRSVAITEHLALRYGGRDDLFVEASHRDITKR